MSIKLDHINISVKNLDQSVQWYKEVFELESVEQGQNGNRRWAILSKNDSAICMTEHKDKKMGQSWPETPYYQVNHFGFRVGNRKAWEEKIMKYKLRLYYGGINEHLYSVSWYVKDPTGHTIEVSYSEAKKLRFPEPT